ncbi:MAG: hypothetical protein HP496_09575 [Nitrospira sp.]|nr:hypothetical protein [Nitrospira sp.]
MCKNRFLWVQAGRVFLVGTVFCTILVATGESALAHGDGISEMSPPHSSPSSQPDLASPEAARLQAACWALTVPYGAAKMAYAIGGGIVGGFAWAVTGGNMEAAKSIWVPSMTGDYIVQPQHLTREKHLYFVGSSSAGPPS